MMAASCDRTGPAEQFLNKRGLIIKETKQKVLDFETLHLDTIVCINRLALRNPMSGGLHVPING